LCTDYEGYSTDEKYASLANSKIDGLVTIPLPSDGPLLDMLANSYLPVVAIADAMPDVTAVVVDDAAGSRLLAEHLASKGYRRILYRRDPYAHAFAVRRLTAFREAASALGMEMTASFSCHPIFQLDLPFVTAYRRPFSLARSSTANGLFT